jgi:hypothetical protein
MTNLALIIGYSKQSAKKYLAIFQMEEIKSNNPYIILNLSKN